MNRENAALTHLSAQFPRGGKNAEEGIANLPGDDRPSACIRPRHSTSCCPCVDRSLDRIPVAICQLLPPSTRTNSLLPRSSDDSGSGIQFLTPLCASRCRTRNDGAAGKEGGLPHTHMLFTPFLFRIYTTASICATITIYVLTRDISI